MTYDQLIRRWESRGKELRILKKENEALLTAARAAQKIKEHGHHWSVDAQTSILHIPPEEIREFRSALKDVEHLL